jgi:hypothetical protein
LTAIDRVGRVALIDDDPETRDMYGLQVEMWEREPVSVVGNLGSLEEFLATDLDVDGAISDFQLQPSGYAQFNGAELVSAWTRRRVPALLCTRFEESQIHHIRPHLRWIPQVLNPTELNPDSIERSFEIIANEIAGNYTPERRPWRAQVRIAGADATDSNTVLVELPSWQVRKTVSVPTASLPPAVRSALRLGHRTFVTANLGCVAPDSLYLSNWEV